MEKQETQAVKAMYVVMANYYGQRLEDATLAMYAEDLDDLPFPAVIDALKELRRDPKVTRCPLPASVRAKILPPNSDDDDGRTAAAQIVAAVRNFGWNNPMLAEQSMGALAWEVVEMQGGWVQVCEMLTTDNVIALQAQWRDLAGSLKRRGKIEAFKQSQLDYDGDAGKVLGIVNSALTKGMD